MEIKEMAKSEKVKDALFEEMEVEANEANLASFERVKAFKLLENGFSQLNILTPNFKL